MCSNLKRLFLFVLVLLVVFINVSFASAAESKKVLYAEMQGSISQAQVALMSDLVTKASADNYDIILIRLDTPGGLGDSMRNIVKIILSSPVPVCIWVGPQGAHAASAGAFIVAAGAISAMAPGTNIGAAIPVSSGGDDLKKSMKTKVMNDFSSFIKSIATKRGRNQQWYTQAVEKGVSIDAQNAVSLNVVNMIATSPEDFIVQIGARGIPSADGVIRFDGAKASIDVFKPGLRYVVLSWLLDPQIAYFLLMGGIIGLFFEFSHPGAVLPGVIGGFCLLTALYALAMLPTSAAGLLLLIFGAVLFLLEIYVVSYGLLSLAAVISLFIGSLILFNGGDLFQVPLSSIISSVLVFAAFAGALIFLVTKSQLSGPSSGQESMVGLEGEVTLVDGNKMKVLVRGEIWNAKPSSSSKLAVGDKIIVDQTLGLMLVVSHKA